MKKSLIIVIAIMAFVQQCCYSEIDNRTWVNATNLLIDSAAAGNPQDLKATIEVYRHIEKDSGGQVAEAIEEKWGRDALKRPNGTPILRWSEITPAQVPAEANETLTENQAVVRAAGWEKSRARGVE